MDLVKSGRQHMLPPDYEQIGYQIVEVCAAGAAHADLKLYNYLEGEERRERDGDLSMGNGRRSGERPGEMLEKSGETTCVYILRKLGLSDRRCDAEHRGRARTKSLFAMETFVWVLSLKSCLIWLWLYQVI
jgi:hypothetical protein